MKQYTNRILRSEDPLDVPGGEVDTSFPLLRPGTYKLVIRSPEIVATKKDPNVKQLVFKVVSDEIVVKLADKGDLSPGHCRKQLIHGGRRSVAAVNAIVLIADGDPRVRRGFGSLSEGSLSERQYCHNPQQGNFHGVISGSRLFHDSNS